MRLRHVCLGVPLGLLAATHASAHRFRVETFNVFNNVNYGQPNGVFGTANFGRISALATGANMRQIQLGAKLIF